MYDQWLEEVEDGKMVGVMMVDLSAAFDMVDHKLLLEKLELFGLDENALQWVSSYLSQRYQSVCVDGCLSPPLPVDCGVPQGSILGPLFYVLFTSEIPDLVHEHPIDVQAPQPYCSQCGSTVCCAMWMTAPTAMVTRTQLHCQPPCLHSTRGYPAI